MYGAVGWSEEGTHVGWPGVGYQGLIRVKRASTGDQQPCMKESDNVYIWGGCFGMEFQ